MHGCKITSSYLELPLGKFVHKFAMEIPHEIVLKKNLLKFKHGDSYAMSKCLKKLFMLVFLWNGGSHLTF